MVTEHAVTNLKPYWRFAKGYKSGNVQSGVMTLSRWPATVHCTVNACRTVAAQPKSDQYR